MSYMVRQKSPELDASVVLILIYKNTILITTKFQSGRNILYFHIDCSRPTTSIQCCFCHKNWVFDGRAHIASFAETKQIKWMFFSLGRNYAFHQ